MGEKTRICWPKQKRFFSSHTRDGRGKQQKGAKLKGEKGIDAGRCLIQQPKKFFFFFFTLLISSLSISTCSFVNAAHQALCK
jgi:hypothetical protein